MKTKTIKVSTLENRFKKLHDAANYAEDCIKTIKEHAELLLQESPTERQSNAFFELSESINSWLEMFVKLGSAMQAVESLYYKHLTDNNTICEMIEPVPTIQTGYMPNLFEISDKLFRIGYYQLEEDIYGVDDHDFSVEEIINDIQTLQFYIIICIKALQSATYSGLWEDVANMINKISEFEAKDKITALLEEYGVDFSSDDV